MKVETFEILMDSINTIVAIIALIVMILIYKDQHPRE